VEKRIDKIFDLIWRLQKFFLAKFDGSSPTKMNSVVDPGR